MEEWLPQMVLEEGDDLSPLFVRIASHIAADIERGRLRSGQRLPSSRELADHLEVHRNTVLAAYRELDNQGLIETQPARGTFVAEDASSLRTRRKRAARPPRKRAGFALPPAPASSTWTDISSKDLWLTGGLPDPRLSPAKLISRAYRRALQRHGADLLDYGAPQGDPRLRCAVADMLRALRGMDVQPDNVLITRGSQMGLWLCCAMLLEPGSRVAVEELGYPAAFDAFRHHGAELVPIPLDEDGLRVDVLEERVKQGPLRAVYVTPHHQYPTLATLSAPRRQRLRDLAREHGFAVIEDDYDNEYHYEGRPIWPMAARNPHGHILYVGTLSKVIAPGLRTGYLVATDDVIAHCSALRTMIDRQGDQPTERALAELLEDGEVQRHIRRTRRIYQERRDVLCDLLEQQLPGVLQFERPRGGMALWFEVDPSIDVSTWAREAKKKGVHFMPGQLTRRDGRPTPHARFGFARVDLEELERAVRILRRTVPARGC